MANSSRKFLLEVNRRYNEILTTGMDKTADGIGYLKHIAFGRFLEPRVVDHISWRTRFAKRTGLTMTENKVKVGKWMSSYEEFIGLKEVKSAHAKVLLAEAKFIECQETRRLASKDLMDSQNDLIEIRAELERSQRGDETYLELVKREMALMKQERKFRKKFEDSEQTEREVFTELSSALRFSHERERAQNEKTKYWSIVGSIIGACLGIVGTTINNRFKQNLMKEILGETSVQVDAIQLAVANLSDKVSQGSRNAIEVNNVVNNLKEQELELAAQRENLSKSMKESSQVLQNLYHAMVAYHNDEFSPDVGKMVEVEEEKTYGQKLLDPGFHLSAFFCAAVGVVVYKLLS